MATIEEELAKLTSSTTAYLQNSTAFVAKLETDYKTADAELEKRVRGGVDKLVVKLTDREIFRFPEISSQIVDGKLYVRYLSNGVARCFLSIRIDDPSSSDQDPFWSIRLPDNLKAPDPESFGVGNTEFQPSTRPERLTLLRPCAVGTATLLGTAGAQNLADGYGAACTFGRIVDEQGAPDRNKFVLLITIPVRPNGTGLIYEIHAQWDYVYQL